MGYISHSSSSEQILKILSKRSYYIHDVSTTRARSWKLSGKESNQRKNQWSIFTSPSARACQSRSLLEFQEPPSLQDRGRTERSSACASKIARSRSCSHDVRIMCTSCVREQALSLLAFFELPKKKVRHLKRWKTSWKLMYKWIMTVDWFSVLFPFKCLIFEVCITNHLTYHQSYINIHTWIRNDY